MSVLNRIGKSVNMLGTVLVAAALAGVLAPGAARAVATEDDSLVPQDRTAPRAAAWAVYRPNASDERLPLARLIRTPDTSGGLPPYALADRTGTIQRYVEPVPGIDLEPYVGFAVRVRRDTGRTLLASQLDLPGQENESILDSSVASDAGSSHGAPATFRGILDPPRGSAMQPADTSWRTQPAHVQPAQYMAGPTQPVVIQESGPMMTGPQGVVTYDPMQQSILGAQMGAYPQGAYPQGAAPIYLDGPAPCDPPGCPTPTPQYYMQPQPYCPPVVPPLPPTRWTFWGEVLWLHPTGVDMAHAQQQDGLGGAGTVPWGEIGVADPDYVLGFRAGGEFRFSPKEAVFVQYAWFDSETTSSLAAPNIPGGGGAVGSLVHHPGAALTASAGPVDAQYDIDFQLGDVAYRYFLSCSKTGELSVFGGARFGSLEQDFLQSGIYGGGLGGDVDTTTVIDFDGVGPMAGVVAERLVGQSRFSVYGRALVAALAGNFRSQYNMYNVTTDTLLAQSIWEDDRIVPMLDYEIGFAWTGPHGHLRLAAGYLASFWFNVVSTPTFVDAVQADNYVNVSDTIAFDGLVGRAEWRW